MNPRAIQKHIRRAIRTLPLTIEAAAKQLRLDAEEVELHVMLGDLPGYVAGGLVRIERSDLEQFAGVLR